ncbi:hypothetical protein [Georgenia deserti]|uniref:Winged helix-turn-helix domain-containing protein n=1 Tax=Georgenia deserti TaxID=2093781 RepID=A0ABW4L3K0_9MICO
MAVREALRTVIAESRPEAVRRQEHGDAVASEELVEFTNVLAEESSALLREAVAGARRQRVSWSRIGARLGMTRQAAQQRFGLGPDSASGAVATSPDEGEVWRLSPVTAFDEMDELARYGRQGWHSIGYGPFFHDLVKDTVQWEHRRVTALGPRRARMEADGWHVVGDGWFPWTYYARRTERPAEPGER